MVKLQETLRKKEKKCGGRRRTENTSLVVYGEENSIWADEGVRLGARAGDFRKSLQENMSNIAAGPAG